MNNFNHKEFSSRGGRARAKNLSQEEIQEIGRKGGIASGKTRKKQAKQKKKAGKKTAKKKPPV
jgi:general stress protein YciG